MNLYEMLGGEAAITAAVDQFYDRVLGDATLAPLFARVPLDRLKGHQRDFLTTALGGPPRYTGRAMRLVHAPIAITNVQFDSVAGHLAATLSALGVPDDLLAQVLDGIAPLREEIVSGPDGGLRRSA
jgi:hemoglobin